jgi:hypothetical protein
MMVSDWRAGDAALLAPLYAAEAARCATITVGDLAELPASKRRGGPARCGFIATGATAVRAGHTPSSRRPGASRWARVLVAGGHGEPRRGLDLTRGPIGQRRPAVRTFEAPGWPENWPSGRGRGTLPLPRSRVVPRSLNRPGPGQWMAAGRSPARLLLAQTYGPDRSRPLHPAAGWPTGSNTSRSCSARRRAGIRAGAQRRAADTAGLLAASPQSPLTTAHLAQLAVRPTRRRVVSAVLLAEVIARSVRYYRIASGE